jgi:hypothetical protein
MTEITVNKCHQWVPAEIALDRKSRFLRPPHLPMPCSTLNYDGFDTSVVPNECVKLLHLECAERKKIENLENFSGTPVEKMSGSLPPRYGSP